MCVCTYVCVHTVYVEIFALRNFHEGPSYEKFAILFSRMAIFLNWLSIVLIIMFPFHCKISAVLYFRECCFIHEICENSVTRKFPCIRYVLCMYVCVHMYVHMNECMCVYMYAQVCVYTYIIVHVHIIFFPARISTCTVVSLCVQNAEGGTCYVCSVYVRR